MALPIGHFSIGSPRVLVKDSVSQATNKARRRPTESPDAEDHIVNESGASVEVLEGPKVSFKDKLIGFSSMNQANREENFELIEGNVVTEMVDGVPYIHFSNRVN